MTYIRSYLEGDYLGVEKLLAECVLELNEKRGGAPIVLAWLDGSDPNLAPNKLFSHLEDFHPAYFVAGEGSLLTGISACWQQGEGAWVAVYVSPEARRNGLGRELLGTAIGELRQRKVTDVDAISTPGDRALKILFEQTGFKTRLLTMRSSL